MAEQTNHGNTPGNRPGLYRHPKSGAEIFVTHHPKFGSAQADGAVAQGYEWVSDEDTLQTSVAEESSVDTESSHAPKSVAELREELAEAEHRELTEKKFTSLNKADLTRLAELEDVELTEEHDTNDKIRAAITAARESEQE
jgi:hypothetical protein